MLPVTIIVATDATISQDVPTVRQSQDPCHGGTKDVWGHTADVLWYCYNGTINATFLIPKTQMKKKNGGWPYTPDKWSGYTWYIEARPSPDYGGPSWGKVVASTDKSWKSSSYGYDKDAKSLKGNYTNLATSGQQISFHLYAEDLKANNGPNCTQHQICAWAKGYDPCWQFALCKVAASILSTQTTGATTITSNIKPAPVDVEAQSTYVIPKGMFAASEPDYPHDNVEHNAWFRAIQQILKEGKVNESCYVCSLMPHTLSQSVLTRPNSYSLEAVKCILYGISHRKVAKPTGKLGTSDMDDTVFIDWDTTNTTGQNSCSQYNNLPIRCNVSFKFMEGAYKPVMTVPPSETPTQHALCFRRHNNRTDNIVVGTTEGCNHTVEATCGVLWNISRCNQTGKADLVKLGNLTIYGPSDDGARTVTDSLWLCGDSLWQILPPHWSGTCALVYLTPTLQLYNSLQYSTHHYPHYRLKREIEAVGMTSKDTKLLSGVVPWWGTVNNAHNIDKLHVQLENLTSIVSDGFAALTPWVAAVRATLIQHRMALDILLASQGGLCHVIGEECCTYIPDIASNLSNTVDHLNSLLADMKKDDVDLSGGWSFWDWLSWGDWRGKLLSLATPLIVVLVLLCVFTTCIVPCIKSCITRLVAVQIQAVLTNYDPLPHDESYASGDADSTTDNEDSEAEDSI